MQVKIRSAGCTVHGVHRAKVM